MKVVLFGCGGVGKGALVRRFVQGVYESLFEDSYPYRKQIEVDGVQVMLEVLVQAA